MRTTYMTEMPTEKNKAAQALKDKQLDSNGSCQVQMWTRIGHRYSQARWPTPSQAMSPVTIKLYGIN